MVKALNGVRVLDLTHAYSGPFATMHLADHGAEVIKIEVPNKGDQTRTWGPMKNNSSGYFAYINRNKKGITLNLKSEKGKKIFLDLVKESDVVCENFRVGTMEKLGLGYEVLKEVNPKVVYASISGFGLNNSYSKKPAYDIIAQALGGIISVTGFKDRQVKVGPAIADNYSGTYLALAVAMALYKKEITGEGSFINVSMVDTIFSILEFSVIDYTIGEVIPEPEANRDPKIAPFDAFEASDGMFVLACGTDNFFHILCDEMGKTELKTDSRFNTNMNRVNNYNELKEIIQNWAKQYTVSEVEGILDGVGIPFGKINNIKEACNFEPIIKDNMLWEIFDEAIGEKVIVPGTPIKFKDTEDGPKNCAPTLGKDTDDVLNKILGINSGQIAELRKDGVI
ncbi:CoA transferase [Peptoniphilus sp. AGMB00490]|uniref:CoA transferase n=1 Tax=Peptoniphilus faecalis TaxID=2731255 RepID=A0A848RFZ5_9FIRM|nr:CoA transferase [Peptoniphilus faecalis]NMW85740.1 CoA transferase [Peptoniphilus faecalis]